MPDYQAILYELRDGVAQITLNRPEAANSLNHQLSSELLDALIRSEENPEVRALVLKKRNRSLFLRGRRSEILLHPG